jgi:pimeloyl-ACP methyl ester carboxylesterase/uncharacterized protein (DUF952 family)
MDALWTTTTLPGARVDGAETSLRALMAGPEGGAPVVLLHGFPETASVWRHQIAALAAAGYRVIAPTLRGYAGSSRPRGLGPYRLDSLVADVPALADALRLGPCHVVGHDWGGAIAWELAARHPERVRTVTVLNAPRADVLRRAALTSLGQLRRSWYILAFMPPLLGEALLARIGPRRLFQGTSAPGTFGEAELAEAAAAWAEPGAKTAMLAYYRANVLPPASAGLRVKAPALLVWGEADVALGPELIAPTLATCDDARLVRLAGVSHWAPAEAPEAVNAALLGHLDDHGGPDRCIYRIVRAGQDPTAPSPLDLRDGFIHLSARGQLAGTLAAHFAGVEGLSLLAIDPGRLPAGALRWEASRGGRRFPHLYGALPEAAIVARLRPSDAVAGEAGA